MSEREKQVGSRVKTFRESAMLSQQDLANKMRRSGFKWSQATVWNVENGDRPLRLTEAIEIADVCSLDPAEFFSGHQQPTSTTPGLRLAVRTLQSLIEEASPERRALSAFSEIVTRSSDAI